MPWNPTNQTNSHGRARQDDQLEPIHNSSVPIQDVGWKTSREQWTIEMGGERESGRSVEAAWHDDDDIQLSWKGYASIQLREQIKRSVGRCFNDVIQRFFS